MSGKVTESLSQIVVRHQQKQWVVVTEWHNQTIASLCKLGSSSNDRRMGENFTATQGARKKRALQVVVSAQLNINNPNSSTLQS